MQWWQLAGALCLWPVLGVMAQENLPAGGAVSGELAAGQAARHVLAAADGELVFGQLHGQGLRLVVLGRDGRVQRRFAAVAGGVLDYQFLCRQAPCTLEVRAPQAAAYRLQRGAQHAATPVSNVLASPQLRALQQRLAAGEGSQAFWQQLAQQGSPLVERDGVQPALADGEILLTFLWRGARHGVTLLGAPSAGHDPLHRLADSDVWYRSYRVPASLRLSYQLAPDPPAVPAALRREALLAVAQRDPLNRQTFPPQALDDFDARSVLTLPAALPAPWLAASAGQGAWQQAWLPAAQAGEQYRIDVYQPVGVQPGRPENGLLLLFDGEALREQVAPALDWLQQQAGMRPTLTVLISNASPAARGRDLPPNPAFRQWLTHTLRPWLAARQLLPRREQVIISGASYGGLAAAWAGLTQDWIGAVYAQSGSFWWQPQWQQGVGEPGWLMREAARSPAARQVRWRLEAGLYEGGGSHPILESSRHLRDVLTAVGAPVQYAEFAAGHDRLHWLATLPYGVLALQ